MARSLSWIDEAELAGQLERAGVAPAARPGAFSESPTSAGPVPGEPTGPSPASPGEAPGATAGPPGEGSGTEPRWPARRPDSGPFEPPVDEASLPDGPFEGEDPAMPGPYDETPVPPSFEPTGPIPVEVVKTAGPTEGDGPVAEFDPVEAAVRSHGEAEAITDVGEDDETPVPPSLRAAIEVLSRHSEEEGAVEAAAEAPAQQEGEQRGEGDMGGSPFSRSSSEQPTSPFLDRPPTGTALARVQLRARERALPEADERGSPSSDFAGRARRARAFGEVPRGPTEEVLALAGDLSRRLDALTVLLVDKTGSRGAYIADGNGFMLARTNCSEAEVALSAALREGLRPVRVLLDDEVERSVTVELAGPEYLHVVWVTSDLGPFAVGLYCGRVLGGDLAPAVRRMLSRVLEESLAKATEPEHAETAPRDEPPAAEASERDDLPSAEPTATESSHDEPAADEAPTPPSGAVALLALLAEQAEDPERALRRVALRTGISTELLRAPERLPKNVLETLEQAITRVLDEA